MKKIAIVVPVYNEADVIEFTISKIFSSILDSKYFFELIFVDDGSKDGSSQIISRHLDSKKFPAHITSKLVVFTRNFGKESAIEAGLRSAESEAVIVMDADSQHPPHLIFSMLEAWENGKGLVIHAVKAKRQKESLLKRLTVKAFYRFHRWLTGYNLENATDFKLLDRSVVNEFLTLRENNKFFRGLTEWLGFADYRIEFMPDETSKAKSSWSLRKLASLAADSIFSFSFMPLRLISFFAMFFFFISIVLSSISVYQKLTGVSEEGFPTVIVLLLFTGSIILISLGIISEYLIHIYKEIKSRPVYIQKCSKKWPRQ